ncbi:outer membrane beta-barrel protein [Acidithiobacillus sp. AMEEHan]|uniref:outer membrane beta-barrel protein n=1 Tax=Acidithiobacillus sp. AMEEHan TaxID=2994951 RepID=UPI0027E3E66E|nr:outer membrane beta-barrel protein [Acidithiobacillus sp. AMEEHan]
MMWGLGLVSGLLFAGLVALPASAMAAPDQPYVNLFGGNTFFGSGSHLDGGGTVGLRVGQRLGRHLGIEAQVASAFARLQDQNQGNANQYSGSVIGNYYTFSGDSSPYLSLGLGASSDVFNQQIGRGTSLMGIFGLGYEQRIGDHFGLRFGVQDHLLFDTPQAQGGPLNNIQITGGISYFWGGSEGKRVFPIVAPTQSGS